MVLTVMPYWSAASTSSRRMVTQSSVVGSLKNVPLPDPLLAPMGVSADECDHLDDHRLIAVAYFVAAEPDRRHKLLGPFLAGPVAEAADAAAVRPRLTS